MNYKQSIVKSMLIFTEFWLKLIVNNCFHISDTISVKFTTVLNNIQISYIFNIKGRFNDAQISKNLLTHISSALFYRFLSELGWLGLDFVYLFESRSWDCSFLPNDLRRKLCIPNPAFQHLSIINLIMSVTDRFLYTSLRNYLNMLIYEN